MNRISELRLSLECAEDHLAALRWSALLHENSMGNWAISGQMRRDREAIARAETECARLRALLGVEAA